MHARKGRLGAAVALGVAAVMALAGCTGSGTTPTSSASQSGVGGTALGTSTLTIAMLTQPPSLDPAKVDEGESSIVWSSLYDTLLYIDNKGKIQPNAAESWKFSDDLLTLTLTLRAGLTFADGSPVQASDVAATMNRTRTSTGTQAGALTAVSGVTAPDSKTVVIKLSRREPSLLLLLASAPGIIAKADNLTQSSLALNPLSSGPYVLSSQTVAGSTYVLERRDNYWNAAAYPYKKLTVKVVADNSAMTNALLAGEIDAAAVQQDQVAQVKSAGFTLSTVPATAIGEILLLDRAGTIQPALADVRVRKAMNMAFDRQAIVKAILGGAGVPTEQLFNPKSGGYVAALDKTYPFDPSAAKKLLAEAGYPNGFKLTMPSTLLSTTFEPAITQALGDIGITVDWVPVPPQEITTSVTDRKYAAAFFFDGMAPDPKILRNHFAGFLNPFGYTTPELTKLMDATASFTDPNEATKQYQAISKYIVDNALNVPLFYVSATIATSPKVKYLADGENGLQTIRIYAPAQ